MHNIVKYVHVKRDYLVRLAAHWCRDDTNTPCIDASARVARYPSVRSSANRESMLSRARTSRASPASTSTSLGRGREL